MIITSPASSVEKGVRTSARELNPPACPHGPQPGVAGESRSACHETHELAVMCGHVHPVSVGSSQDLDDGKLRVLVVRSGAGRCRTTKRASVDGDASGASSPHTVVTQVVAWRPRPPAVDENG